jgi:SAM-dependent methyltransferase
MHGQARDFTVFVKKILNDFFINKRVLDVGSGDINGNNRFLFDNCEYDGNDVIQANNVTIVSKTKDLPFQDNTFDTIISTECFEHDPEYRESLSKIYKMLKPDGLFCFTCASSGRAEHGTRRTSPTDSYGTIGQLEDMSDYYKNLTHVDLNEVLNLNELFSSWDTYYNAESNDLYFVGIKVGASKPIVLEKYVNNCVVNTLSKTGVSNNGWFIVGIEGQLITEVEIGTSVRYGLDGIGWIERTVVHSRFPISNEYFGWDPAPGVRKILLMLSVSK